MCHRSLSADTSEVSLRTVRWGGTLLRRMREVSSRQDGRKFPKQMIRWGGTLLPAGQ